MKAVSEDMIGAADLVVTLGREVSVGEVEGEGCLAQPGQGDTEVFDAVGPTLMRAAVMTRSESWGPTSPPARRRARGATTCRPVSAGC
jgi:hypothetical protein